jgi:hypothetical protein
MPINSLAGRTRVQPLNEEGCLEEKPKRMRKWSSVENNKLLFMS